MQKCAPVYRNSEDLAKGKSAIDGIMKKYKDVGIKDRSMVWNMDLIETLELENLINQAVQEMLSAEARQESRGTHEHENYPDSDDVNWTKHPLSFLDAPCVGGAEVVLRYHAVIDQPMDKEMHHVPPAKRVPRLLLVVLAEDLPPHRCKEVLGALPRAGVAPPQRPWWCQGLDARLDHLLLGMVDQLGPLSWAPSGRGVPRAASWAASSSPHSSCPASGPHLPRQLRHRPGPHLQDGGGGRPGHLRCRAHLRLPVHAEVLKS
jgi:hypothetical protein